MESPAIGRACPVPLRLQAARSILAVRGPDTAHPCDAALDFGGPGSLPPCVDRLSRGRASPDAVPDVRPVERLASARPYCPVARSMRVLSSFLRHPLLPTMTISAPLGISSRISGSTGLPRPYRVDNCANLLCDSVRVQVCYCCPSNCIAEATTGRATSSPTHDAGNNRRRLQ